MSTEPAREEAWNCNRCRDTGAIVWNFEVYRCENGCPVRLGSLPLQQGQTDGGAGAGSVGGPSHDTEPTPCAFCHRPQADGYATIGDERYCHGDDPYPTCYMKASWGMTPKRTDWDGIPHTDPCCKGGPDCLCEPEGL